MKLYRGAIEQDKLYLGSSLIWEKAIPQAGVVESGLVVYYDFKDKTNSSPDRAVATDLSGNGNHSNLLNFGWSSSSGYTADGLIFDGVDDMIKGTNLAGMPVNGPWTMEVTSTSDNSQLDRYMTLMAIGLGPMFTPTNGYKTLEIKSGSRHMYFARYVGDEIVAPTGYPLFPTQIRTHVAVTYDPATQVLAWYFNGSLIGTSTGITMTTQSNPPLYIGLDEHDYSEARIHTFQAARVYNRALTTAEIQQNYDYDESRWNV